MSKASAKKIHKDNQQQLASLRIFGILVNAIYCAYRYAFTGFKTSHLQSVGAVNVVFLFSYFYLVSLAKPVYDAQGKLSDAGYHLNGPNITAYVFDLVYIGWFATLGSLFSHKVWLVYLLIPIFIGYKLVKLALKLFGK